MSPATSRAAGAFLASLGASEATVAAAERTTVAQTVKELFAVQGAPVREAGGGVRGSPVPSGQNRHCAGLSYRP